MGVMSQRETKAIQKRFKLSRYYLHSIREKFKQFVAYEITQKGGTPRHSDHMAKAFAEFSQWFSDFDESGKLWFCFMGGVGTGKTTLMKAMFEFIRAIQLTDHGEYASFAPFRAKFVTAVQMAEYMRTDRQKYNEIKNYQVLFIDDIGTEPTEIMDFGNILTPFVDIINDRYNNNLCLVFTTNLDATAIRQRYGERTADRMREFCKICVCDGESLRKQTKSV